MFGFGKKTFDVAGFEAALKNDAQRLFNESISNVEIAKSFAFISPKDQRKYHDLAVVAMAKAAAIEEIIDKMKDYK